MYVVNIHEQSEMHKDAVFKEIADDHGTEVAFDIMQINYKVCSGLNIPPIEMLYSCKKFKCATRTGRCTGDETY